MGLNNRTYRVVDGEQIEGTWRPIFIRNGPTYYLTDLLIFADGAIYCWEWVDLDGLRRKVESGWVATEIEAGAAVSALHLGGWRFDEPQGWVTAEELLGEVADEIDLLNGRPDSTGRCRQALERFLETRVDVDRELLRVAYLAIPDHVRQYALGDMDSQDQPLRVLCTPVGELTTHDELVTDEMHAEALEYFEEWQGSYEKGVGEQTQSPTVMLASVPGRWPAEPGIECLRNEQPSTVDIGGDTYASAMHAYWALATTDESARAMIREAATAFGAERAAGEAPIRPDWPHLRLAAMRAVLRAKFGQHPELADVLLATGDARIDYSISSAYWSGGTKGRNWLGRLLELVRSEIAAERAGFTP